MASSSMFAVRPRLLIAAVLVVFVVLSISFGRSLRAAGESERWKTGGQTFGTVLEEEETAKAQDSAASAPETEQAANLLTSEEEEEEEEAAAKPESPFHPVLDGRKLSFTDTECDRKFPGGFAAIDWALARGYVGSKAANHDGEGGFVRARIYDGGLYIVAKGSDVWHRMSSTAHQIHRAILTAPDPLEIPNIEFTYLVNDHPRSQAWSLARAVRDPQWNDTWLMPDYATWSWPEPHIGSYDEAREKISNVDTDLPWSEKKNKALWRGTVGWNADLRGKLVKVAKGKHWSDVEELNWDKNALGIEDFCRSQFLVYTEGVTYSGRLRYFQHCRSVIITPPLKWQQYDSAMIQPEGPNQNIVYVKEDWSDLEETIEHLRAHPEQAERIANNTVKTFRDHYLTPAFETCYWRKLFRAWEKVTDPVGKIDLKDRGTRWESYVLMGALDWKATA